jgi:hypothetical protein
VAQEYHISSLHILLPCMSIDEAEPVFLNLLLLLGDFVLSFVGAMDNYSGRYHVPSLKSGLKKNIAR